MPMNKDVSKGKVDIAHHLRTPRLCLLLPPALLHTRSWIGACAPAGTCCCVDAVSVVLGTHRGENVFGTLIVGPGISVSAQHLTSFAPASHLGNRILMCESVSFSDVSAVLGKGGVKLSKRQLSHLLDQQGITHHSSAEVTGIFVQEPGDALGARLAIVTCLLVVFGRSYSLYFGMRAVECYFHRPQLNLQHPYAQPDAPSAATSASASAAEDDEQPMQRAQGSRGARGGSRARRRGFKHR